MSDVWAKEKAKFSVDIQAELRNCLELGVLTNKFAEMASALAWRLTRISNLPVDIHAEAVSDFTYRLVRKWHLIDPERNVSSYLQSMIYSTRMDILRRYERSLKRRAAFQMVIDAHGSRLIAADQIADVRFADEPYTDPNGDGRQFMLPMGEFALDPERIQK